MPRIVPSEEKAHAISLMESGVSQREIARSTGLSRPFLRKLAKEINFRFPQNGIDVVGLTCMCANCGAIFRRSPSKVIRSKRQFCSEQCRIVYSRGPNHPSWRHGETLKSFSEWLQNQSDYEAWRRQVLERDQYRCVISGKCDNLDVHHILPKGHVEYAHLALDVNNGITICQDVHRRIHKLIHEGVDFSDAVEVVRKEYQNSEGE